MRSISRHDGLKAEVIEVLPELARRASKAEPFDIMAELIALAPIYGISDRTDEEWATLFSAYLEALAPLPIEAIRAGIVEYNREGEFFPKPGQIYQKAEPIARKLFQAAYRAKRAAEWVEQNPAPKSDEERARDRQALIEAGLMTPDGKFAPLNFKRVQDPERPKETPQEMAARLKRIADGTAAIEGGKPLSADDLPEAI